jgi:hypothetical protein
MQDVANDMGEYLCSMRSWKWKEPRRIFLSTRAPITITNGNWDDSDTELFPSSGDDYASYDWVPGDYVNVTAGTGVTTGRVDVTGTLGSSPTGIVLASTIATTPGDLNNADIEAKLHTDSIFLPTNVKELIDVEVTDGLFTGVELTDRRTILRKRTSALEVTSPWKYYAAVSYPDDANGIPAPILELWPSPSSNQTDQLSAIVKVDWTRLTTDSSTVAVPSWMYRLFKTLCREAWLGLHEHDGIGLEPRVAAIHQGPLMMNARHRDAGMQVEQGPIENGHAELPGRHIYKSFFNNDTLIGGPS